MKVLHEQGDKEVVEALKKFELYTLHSTGTKHWSGGYATAEIYDEDDEDFIVELKWGVQSDCRDTSHTETHRMCRRTLEIRN